MDGKIAGMPRWIDTLRDRAASKLPAPVFEYFDQGAGDGRTAAEATAAWDRLRLRPHVLRDVSSVSTATTVLGQDVATPILAAPSTLQLQADPGGEPAVVRGVNDAGGLTCVSSNSGTLFNEIGTHGEPWWVQAYVMRDRGASLELLRRATEAGASAVVLTADTPVVGRKVNAGPSVWSIVPPEQVRANLNSDGLAESALHKADDLTPDDIGWLRDELGVPVVVKGVLRGDDAKICADAGAEAVWVSNHGGRQLDQAISTADALTEVAEALASTDIETYVDGGLNCGVHVLAALSLGARAVFLGRLTLWALAVDGEGGVRRLYTDMADELREAMTLAGAAKVDEISPDLIHRLR